MSVNRMTVAEFVERGFLQEVNRLLLHPCGVALEVVVEEDGSMRFGGAWDYRDDPEGMVFGDAPSEGKADAIRDLRISKEPARRAKYGWVQQPAGEAVTVGDPLPNLDGQELHVQDATTILPPVEEGEVVMPARPGYQIAITPDGGAAYFKVGESGSPEVREALGS